MSTTDSFKKFLSNIAVDNDEVITLRYEEITSALNKTFRDTDSKTANSLQVGSYGRWTAIKGISDLDMLYIMPTKSWDKYDIESGQSKLLTDVCNAIAARYPSTDVFVDRLVVRALYADFHIEVQPVFEEADSSFTYPDTIDDGRWKITKPRLEIQAMSAFDGEKNKNLRRLCKMARSWKNKHGLAIGGLLIDTLAHNFLKNTTTYDDKSYQYYDEMCRDFFQYLSNEPDQDRYAALGSGQHVKVKKKFQRKAKTAYEQCLDAIAAVGQKTNIKNGEEFLAATIRHRIVRSKRRLSARATTKLATPKSTSRIASQSTFDAPSQLTARFLRTASEHINFETCWRDTSRFL